MRYIIKCPHCNTKIYNQFTNFCSHCGCYVEQIIKRELKKQRREL